MLHGFMNTLINNEKPKLKKQIDLKYDNNNSGTING